MFKNYRKQGDAGMGQAIAWATSQGYTVSIPLTDCQNYDLVVDTGIKLLKVQVKTTLSDKVELRTRGGNRSGKQTCKYFDPSSVDALFVYQIKTGNIYWLLTESMKNKTALSIKNLVTWQSG